VKKSLIAILVVGLAAAFWLPYYQPPTPAKADTPQVVINELAWPGSSKAANDEWIELYNPSGAEVDIASWVLTKDTGTEAIMITLPALAVIPAGGFFIISRLDRTASAIDIDPNFTSSAMTLSNTALRIKLYKGDWQDPANLVDTAGDGGAPPAGNNSAKISMERDADLGGWHDAQSAVNLDAGIIDVASPGAVNSVISQPPTITSINPNTAVAGAVLNIEEIVGTNFGTNTVTVRLERDGQILTADEVHLASPELIDAGVWELPEDAAGNWDLTVITEGGLSATLAQAVTVHEPPPQFDMSTLVRINEVYPQPGTTANDEFVELTNLAATSVNLNGWELDDVSSGGSAPFKLDGLVLPPSGFLTLYKPQSKITLNDSGDTVRLIQPSGMVLDSTSYAASIRGQSWAKNSSGWQWTTTPTPNGLNVFTEEEGEEDTPPAVEEEEDDTPIVYQPGVITIDELLPRPMDGEEEFIELSNPGSGSIDLAGWTLADKSNRKYKFPAGSRLAGGARLVIYAAVSKISLNNSGGEEVALLDTSGKTISELNYPDTAPEDSAYIRISSTDGTWTQPPTPGQPNPIDLAEVEKEVGGWVESDIVNSEAADELPVTGWMSLGGLGLVSGSLVAIMGARKKRHGPVRNQRQRDFTD
jgi:hypothetical protein